MTAPAPAVPKTPAEPEVIVPTNPALLDFPTDPWGFTSALKKETLRAASTVQAQPDKQALLLATMELLIEHIKARFPTDQSNKDAFAEQARKAYAERHNRRRYNWVGKVDS